MNRIELNPEDDGHPGWPPTMLRARHLGGRVTPACPFSYPRTLPFAQTRCAAGHLPDAGHMASPAPPQFDVPLVLGCGDNTCQPHVPSSRRQNRPVEVHCGPSTYYHCNRDDLLYHFPALRQEPFGRKLHPMQYITWGHKSDSSAAALRHIFRGLEAYRTTGQALAIFERADDLLERTSASDRGFLDAYKFFLGVCLVCAREGGLGCSEEILRQIDDFAVGLVEMWEERLPLGVIRNVVTAYSKVFRPSSPRHMETLRTVWNSVPAAVRGRITLELIDLSGSAPQTASCQTFYRALRDLSAV